MSRDHPGGSTWGAVLLLGCAGAMRAGGGGTRAAPGTINPVSDGAPEPGEQVPMPLGLGTIVPIAVMAATASLGGSAPRAFLVPARPPWRGPCWRW